MSEDNIRVHVVEYADRPHLVLRYKDPINGKQKTRSAKTDNRKAAEKAAAVWEDELRSGRYASPSKTTWADFRERYEVEVLSSLSPRTLQQVSIVFDLIERLLSPQKVRDLTAQRLSWLGAELRKETKIGDKVKPGLSEASIKSYFAHTKAAMRWAERTGLIAKAPAFPKLHRATAADAAKGRAITGEEFDRMLAAVPKIVGEARSAEWGRYIRGLWLSGFRVGESLSISWDEGAGIVVDLSGRNAVAHVAARAQKSNRTQALPLTPDFSDMLAETPVERRIGPVFNPLGKNGKRVAVKTAISTISSIGRRANVKTWTNPKTGVVKCATAHDLRRSFGTRWSALVMPAVLQQMMRHSSIETTLAFYVTRNAVTTGDVIRQAAEKAGLGNNSGNNPTAEHEKSTHS